ncbi:HAD-IC family P-type ATPase [Thermodesulfovibrio sp.]|uniref:cation-translocating P-type ATPase n=1 Tax=Thermodesulfovibrio sp. TaxID=2067987 RepID=UPI0030A8B14A
MVRIVHKEVSGRVRLKIIGLKNSKEFGDFLFAHLEKLPFISDFSVNITTGSLLIYHSPQKNLIEIIQTVEYLAEEFRKTFINENSKREQEKPESFKERIIKKIKDKIPFKQEKKYQDWHLLDWRDIVKDLQTDETRGLSSDEAKRRLKNYGANSIESGETKSGFSLFLNQFKSVPVILLGVASIISLFTGGITDAIFIIGVVITNAIIGYKTERKTESLIKSLNKIFEHKSEVIRDGQVQSIESEELVPGDIVLLKPGSFVNADCRLIESINLSVDESALTGESLPVTKFVNLCIFNNGDNIPLADRCNMVYRGTFVVGGHGKAVVVETGNTTEIGKIKSLIEESETPKTAVQNQLDRLGIKLSIISALICAAVFVLGLLRGYGIIEMLKSSISLAVAAVPEGLPTVATTTFALGMANLRRQGILIRELKAVETLGTINTICFDKTGTLTLNKMSVAEVFIDTKLYQSDGKNLYEFQSEVKVEENPTLKELLKISILCNDSKLTFDNGKYNIVGTPTENALVKLANYITANPEELREKYKRIKTFYRAENRHFMLTIHETENPDEYLVAIKGAPDRLLEFSNQLMHNGEIKHFTERELLLYSEANELMSSKGLRVLGFCYGILSKIHRDLINELNSEDCNCSKIIDSIDIVWLGLIGFKDPIREGVKELIERFHLAGIETVMITGDQSLTATAIAEELSLSRKGHINVVETSRLENGQTDIDEINVFSRATPTDKLKIVKALQSKGKYVAMTGDGINDGPALKVADLGISMGKAGTEIARDVAEIVIEDDDLSKLELAIANGRNTYVNIRKSIHYLVSTNLSEIFTMFSCIALKAGQPLTPIQLLWINLISDIFPGLALSIEPLDRELMKQPPRNPDEELLNMTQLRRHFLEASAITLSTMTAYLYGISRYGVSPASSSIAFLSLSLSQILHAYSCKSERKSILSSDTFSNKYLNLAVGGTLLLQIALSFIPGLRNLLGLTPLKMIDYGVVSMTTLGSVLINESLKKTKN